MRRIDGERGAVAILVALLMVVLFGFAAIGVDVANMASDKQQLQNGADAGALAIAESCAQGDCGDYDASALLLARSNKNDGLITDVDVLFTTKTVEVVATGTTKHWFAPVLGSLTGETLDSSPVVADATATWAKKLTGTAGLPLAIDTNYLACIVGGSGAVFSDGTSQSIFVEKDGFYELRVPSSEKVKLYLADWAQENNGNENNGKDDEVAGCSLVDGAWTPGGFGWLFPDPDTCEKETVIGGTATVKPGLPPPNGCKQGILRDLIGQPIVLPVFLGSDAYGSGAGGEYRIAGYVAFMLDGYYIPATSEELVDPFTKGKDMCAVPGSNASEACLIGHFTTVAALEGTGSTVGADSGTYIIELKD